MQRTTLKTTAIAAAALLLGGCVAAQEAAYQRNYLRTHNVSPRIEQLIRQGKITRGMTKKQVLASWGKPCSYCIGTRSNSYGDTWAYGNPAWAGMSYVYFNNRGRVRGWSIPGQ